MENLQDRMTDKYQDFDQKAVSTLRHTLYEELNLTDDKGSRCNVRTSLTCCTMSNFTHLFHLVQIDLFC